MEQRILKIPGSEYKIDRVLSFIISKKFKIASISIATGGGFMAGESITYIVIENYNDDITFNHRITEFYTENIGLVELI
jgi:hypothetical protein